MKRPVLELGVHTVDLVCPRCHRHEVALVGLHSVLSVPDDDKPSLRVKVKGRAVDHECGQTSLRIVDGEATLEFTTDDE